MNEAHVEAHVDLASPPQEIPASAPTEAIIDMLKERGALSAIVLAQLPTVDTADLLNEVEDRLDQQEVLDFIADNASTSDFDDDSGVDLSFYSSDDLLAELSERTDLEARSIADAVNKRTDFTGALGEPGGGNDLPILHNGVLTISAALLTYLLTAASSVTERRNTISILGTVLIQAGDNMLRVVGTDLDSEVRADFIIGKTEGADFLACVAPHALLNSVRQLPTSTVVTLKHDEASRVLTIEFDGGSLSLPTLAAAEWPTFSYSSTGESLRDTAGLIEALDAVRPAVSTEETRYYLNGACLNRDGGAPTITATDGHRLASRGFLMPEAFADQRAIIPTKALDLARWLFRDRVTLAFIGDDKRISFNAQGITLRAKLIDGKFPEWDVVRKAALNGSKTVTLDRAKLLSAVMRAVPFSSERSRAVWLDAIGGRCNVTVENPDTGKVVLDGGPAEGDFLASQIGINGNYLLAALRQVPGEAITLRGEDPGSPVVVSSAEQSAGDIIILMPLRV